MSIICACMQETNCATGKRIPGHFFTFKSCIVCKCKVKRVKRVFPLSWNWWVALRFLFTPWKEIELFLVLILCYTKWRLVNCFVLGSENSDSTEALDSLRDCPGPSVQSLCLEDPLFNRLCSVRPVALLVWHLCVWWWSVSFTSEEFREPVFWKVFLYLIRDCLRPSQHQLGMFAVLQVPFSIPPLIFTSKFLLHPSDALEWKYL